MASRAIKSPYSCVYRLGLGLGIALGRTNNRSCLNLKIVSINLVIADRMSVRLVQCGDLYVWSERRRSKESPPVVGNDELYWQFNYSFT